MKPPDSPDAWRPLPHEFFFGLFLFVTWMRLGFMTGFLGGDALLYLALIGANLWAIWFVRSNGTPRRWRLGLLFYPVAMNIVFMHMKTAVPKIHPARMDAWLQQIDSLCVGTNLSLRLQPLVHPALTEILSFCYILFFPYLLFSMVYYFCSELELLKKFVIGLFTIYGIGFLGYSLVPAAGPYHAIADQFTAPLTGGWITGWNAAVVAAGSNGVDVFPSLHCAISSFFLFFDHQHRPWRFKLYLAPCVGLWASTIYLRYHYAIDVVCGFALSGLALWLAQRFPRAQHTPAAIPTAPAGAATPTADSTPQ
ncbi:MAG TPA: phosphatase PAP2 family protein [Verrucomicrobiae bacterium]|nr:phosphatase PAP2 family protein [Verrucomicrobiae bacterium]